MDELEARSAAEELSKTLRGIGAAWVVDQVAATSALGVTDVVTVDSRRRVVSLESAPRRRPSVQREPMLRTRPYTANEELVLLLDAIKKAVGDAQLLSDAVIRYSRGEHEKNERLQPRVQFVSSEDGRVTLTLDGESLKPLDDELMRALADLRTMA